MCCRTRQSQWKPLKIADYTRNMNESGTVGFFVPPGLVKTADPYVEEWENLYWLKVIVDKEEWRDMPSIHSVHMNTTIAAQVEHVEDEIVGSSDGNASQEFVLLRTPVISEEILVEETGKPGETSMRWQRVEDFFASSSTDRHYMIDRVSGAVVFGNGINGKIPPLGKDNIIASYLVGGGKKGNVDAFEINDMKISIPYVDRVINPEPARGGGDNEQIEDVLNRGPYLIKHRNRAVTLEDFQRMAVDVSGSIARAKAVLKDDCLILMVIPREPVDKPLPSPVLLKEVKDRLIGHSINTLSASNILVRGPGYVEVSITARIVPVSYEDAPVLETLIIDRLREYLHPLTGGPDRRGWEFGRGLHISDVYALLESIEGVDHAVELRLNEKEADVGVNEFHTLCTGIHKIEIF
jgi:predicted phage baseplate assembly protein